MNNGSVLKQRIQKGWSTASVAVIPTGGTQLEKRMTHRNSKRRTRQLRSSLAYAFLFFLGVIITAGHIYLFYGPREGDHQDLQNTTGKALRNHVLSNDQDLQNTSTEQNASAKMQKTGAARFPNGTLGLVIDPSQNLLNDQNMPTRKKSCRADRVIDLVAFQVFKLIRTGVIKSKAQMEERKRKAIDKSGDPPKILCMVYTHSGAHSRIQAIVNTWGSQCDGFFAASNETDLSIGAIDLVHKGPEAYSNMWQKIRSMWVYAHDNFLDDYDYFHIAGDDAYVVVENMKNFLQGAQIERLLNGYIDTFSRPFFEKRKSRWENMSESQKRPLLLGIPLLKGNGIFPQGGGGYTLNREALRLIGDEGGPLHTLLTDNVDSREDLFIASLLSTVDTYVSDTRDETGAFRYIPYKPKQRVRGQAKYPPKYKISPELSGMDLFSSETVALHLKEMDRKDIPMDEVIYRTHDIINGACDAKISRV